MIVTLKPSLKIIMKADRVFVREALDEYHDGQQVKDRHPLLDHGPFVDRIEASCFLAQYRKYLMGILARGPTTEPPEPFVFRTPYSSPVEALPAYVEEENNVIPRGRMN